MVVIKKIKIMNIIELNKKPNISENSKSYKPFTQFGALLDELRKRELPENIISTINSSIEKINAIDGEDKDLNKIIKQQQTVITKQLEKELKIVPKNYYRTIWMLLGFTAFGLPLGVAFGLSVGNIGLIGIGLPIGMVIGALAGMSMDKKALAEGRQLAIELN